MRYDQVFERGDKRQLRIQSAEAQLQAAEAQVLDVTRLQMFQMKQAFYQAVLARENLKVADENLYLINNTEQLIKLHVAAGDTAEGELIRFQSNKVQYQRDFVTAQLTYQQSARDILNLLGAQAAGGPPAVTIGGADQLSGLLADAPLEVVGELRAEPVTLSIADLERATAASRPDVIAAQKQVDAAARALELAEALKKRDIDVGWEYQRVGGENTVGVVVSVPLFVNNNHDAEIAQAQAQLNQAKAQLAQVRMQALTDVDKAYRGYEMARRMVDLYTVDTVQKAEEAFRIAGVSYKEGATSLLELRDAQRTYNQTRVAANQARYDYLLSLYQLEQATGKQIVKH
jgi:cobalt-zinc-cadmium efflux system outer membrane protein